MLTIAYGELIQLLHHRAVLVASLIMPMAASVFFIMVVNLACGAAAPAMAWPAVRELPPRSR